MLFSLFFADYLKEFVQVGGKDDFRPPVLGSVFGSLVVNQRCIFTTSASRNTAWFDIFVFEQEAYDGGGSFRA